LALLENTLRRRKYDAETPFGPSAQGKQRALKVRREERKEGGVKPPLHRREV